MKPDINLLQVSRASIGNWANIEQMKLDKMSGNQLQIEARSVFPGQISIAGKVHKLNDVLNDPTLNKTFTNAWVDAQIKQGRPINEIGKEKAVLDEFRDRADGTNDITKRYNPMRSEFNTSASPVDLNRGLLPKLSSETAGPAPDLTKMVVQALPGGMTITM